MEGSPDNPPWHSFMGYYPNITDDNSYMSVEGGGSNPCQQNKGYPTVVAVAHFD